ncbi:Hypothetical predicted protein [Pelobates cultripes]|uniref:Uncharacterized protein n=1 Tax=Pelobates cultripes TaxID=61616 RepID=A0AAD1RAG1_PELCU|nr:Hypothetical predicted protein [Pelobates cultripes]
MSNTQSPSKIKLYPGLGTDPLHTPSSSSRHRWPLTPSAENKSVQSPQFLLGSPTHPYPTQDKDPQRPPLDNTSIATLLPSSRCPCRSTVDLDSALSPSTPVTHSLGNLGSVKASISCGILSVKNPPECSNVSARLQHHRPRSSEGKQLELVPPG